MVNATRQLADALAQAGHSVHLLTGPPADRPVSAASIEPLAAPVAWGVLRGAAPDTARHNLLHAAAAYRHVRRIHEQEQPVDAVLAPLWNSEGAVCLLDESFPTIVSCMTSLRTLREVDPAVASLLDIEQRLGLEHRALTTARYLHGLTRSALDKTIADYELHPELSAVVARGLRDTAPTERPQRELPQLLFVGRIEPRKGVDTLLDAVAELVRDGFEFELTLAGPELDPSFRRHFEAHTAELPKLASTVTFAGWVSDHELSRLYSAADIVCAPSRYESHGIVLIEAMMFGKAIVTTAAGGIEDVVTSGRDALVAPVADSTALARCLRELLTDPEQRRRLGDAARGTFERRFDVREVAKQMESFIADVVARHRTSDGSVAQRLEQFLQDVLWISDDDAHSAAAELLDPSAAPPLRRLRAAALTAPAPSTGRRRRIAAVVLTRDRPELLEHALNSIADSEHLAETLVIDDDSAPAHAQRIAAICAGRDRLTLHRSTERLGTSGGRRLGIETTHSELLLFLDDDAELLPGALDHLLGELDAEPSVGAVTATVISSDGAVCHSGGRLERHNGTVDFQLIGAGDLYESGDLPPSGTAEWIPGTAVLVRRALLNEFPLDSAMTAYFEDNEWSYRVSLARPGSFRRSREALALHRCIGETAVPPTNRQRVELLAAATRFYRRHGIVLGPSSVDAVLPELRGPDGARDIASAKLMMELLEIKGKDWIVGALDRGELAGLLTARRNEIELADARAEIDRLKQAIGAYEQTAERLHERYVTLRKIEQGGWWRLRARILPLVRVAGDLRRRLRGGRDR